MKDLFPLANALRPTALDDFEGQDHLTGEGRIIRSLIENKELVSVVLWGPPGTGKTTLLRILVKVLNFPVAEFSATVSGISEIKSVMRQASEARKIRSKPLVLFVDEIHHFNRVTQDAFLPYVERGDVILMGTTTENPAYKINRALLSRLRILEFFPLKPEHLRRILKKAVTFIKKKGIGGFRFSKTVEEQILQYSNGDARRLLNLIELITQMRPDGKKITPEFVAGVIQREKVAYDRSGDDRYQLISAFHKCVRNSDVDASLFWLYRMLEGGEDPLYILRRMVRISVEDIGLADPEAIQICLNAKAAYEFLGSPEGDLFLTETTIYLATAPKSNSLYLTEKRLKSLVEKYHHFPVPPHLINPANFISIGKGFGKNYLYAHDFKEKTTVMETLPEGILEKDFYNPGEMGFEKRIRERMDYWKRLKSKIKSDGESDK